MRARERVPEAVRRQILLAIEDGWRTDGRSPSCRKVSAALGGQALSLIKHHVDALVRGGQLTPVDGSRGVLPVRPVELPLAGDIVAGSLLDDFDTGDMELLELETLTSALPGAQPPFKRGVFALRVRGDSMIDDGILDGGFALIAAGPTVAPGAIAVVLHRSANGGRGEVTLKHVDAGSEAVRLRPANPEYSVRVIARKEWDREWTAQGALVEVRRHYA
jgi:repressor LexA